MFLTDNLSVNKEGHLTLAGMDTVELASKYGTPLYLMDEDCIRKNMEMYKSSINRFYNGKGLVCYASKAFSCKQIYRAAAEEGIGVDVVSMGELYTALSVGTDPALICYHGNNKSHSELEYAVDKGVGWIVADSLRELDMLEEIAIAAKRTVKLLLRIGPGIEAHTHDYVMTGSVDSKFGFAIKTGDAIRAVEKTLSMEHLSLEGIHCHIGSQIFELEPFSEAARVMFSLIAEIKSRYGKLLPVLNLGGGFGIKYTPSDKPVEYERYMEIVSKTLKEVCSGFGMELPFVIIEPGRSIVGPAGVTLYEVGTIKEIADVRTYVSVDGGITDNIRYALYHADYEFIIANKANNPKDTCVAVAGRCCESGDLLAKATSLQACEPGDIMAVLATGAYNYSMSSNYNRVTKPAVVMLRDGKSYVAVKRETLEDLIRNDI